MLLSPLSYALDRLGRPLRVRLPASTNATAVREDEAGTGLPLGGSAGLDRGVLGTHGPLAPAATGHRTRAYAAARPE